MTWNWFGKVTVRFYYYNFFSLSPSPRAQGRSWRQWTLGTIQCVDTRVSRTAKRRGCTNALKIYNCTWLNSVESGKKNIEKVLKQPRYSVTGTKQNGTWSLRMARSLRPSNSARIEDWHVRRVDYFLRLLRRNLSAFDRRFRKKWKISKTGFSTLYYMFIGIFFFFSSFPQ